MLEVKAVGLPGAAQEHTGKKHNRSLHAVIKFPYFAFAVEFGNA